MRKVALTAICLLFGSNGHGQGYLVFGNRITVTAIDAPVYDVDGVTGLAGPAFRAQLYWSTSPDSLSPVGPILDFRTGRNAGYIDSTVVAIPGTSPGSEGWVEMRAWAATQGATWEAAATTGYGYGRSYTLAATLGEAVPAPRMYGLEAFALVPEPSSGLLLVVGVLWFILDVSRWKAGKPANHPRQAPATGRLDAERFRLYEHRSFWREHACGGGRCASRSAES